MLPQEKFELDSGSTVNIMTNETVIKFCGQDGLSELEETPVTLVMYNQSEDKKPGQEGIQSRKKKKKEK